ncbi:hypothetical protein BV509_20200 [Rhodovulum sulfidophilum]|uniref:DUF4139 domain-containing protein n=1 Tax=Rhodovulum visakhapatnamense TaxID=364297 RepID=A0ABS1REB9_9RHOB|nr:DUF4139 domain-containing protein [Rhodovulum visakhapatnamense]MBL3570093.1 DUF4139 domain-containing protein [Rhodovulum visakhapatnamense]MBL3577987.1 DUF4139 domain-containing protein [Rhodovulum visakhapatnamense]OLS46443.1 hypothetical protein BV509_20200 [Rhodovulum sulfidophilum]
MRAFALCLILTPLPVWADDLLIPSRVSAVTLFPDGAAVTRSAAFDLPAGAHRLILADLPATTPLGSVRVAVEGASLGSVSARRDFVLPRGAGKSPEIEAAEAEVERRRQALEAAEADISRTRAEAQGAEARAAFLGRLGQGEAAMTVEDLRALARMIGTETEGALADAIAARGRADAAERGLTPLRAALAEAEQALAALVPEDAARAMLAIAVTGPEGAPVQGEVTVSYTVEAARWRPVYDLRLDRAARVLTVERGALVAQETGETWSQVALSLSTARPGGQTAPRDLWPLLRRISDPVAAFEPSDLAVRSRAVLAAPQMAEMDAAPAGAAPVIAVAELDGLAVSYDYPAAVDIATGADNLRLSLGDLAMPVELVAEAVPEFDDSAYLVASLVNETGEILLPSSEAMAYLDGRFVGQQAIGLIPAGAEADLPFGPIDGLRLTRTVLDRNEGDRGVLKRSNEQSEAVRIEVENLTGESWPVRLLDRVPYSEQEDLKIVWQADPAPTGTDVEGRRGLLDWRFDLAPGATREVALSHRLTWPEGKVLD